MLHNSFRMIKCHYFLDMNIQKLGDARHVGGDSVPRPKTRK
jgi:hypothetical protein